MNPLRRLKTLLPQRHPLRLLWHRLRALCAALRYGFPARSLTVIGITGTDGKTTTVAMVAHVLESGGQAVAAVTTSFLRVAGKTEENPTHKTSLSPFALQRFLRRCVRQGCTIAVVECSSHGLVQHRLDFLWPSVAAITNTSPEHLDYHGTMERYRRDKGLLFGMLRGAGTKVLNERDGTFALYSAMPSQKTVVYSTDQPGRGAESSDEALWLSGIATESAAPSAVLHCRQQSNHTQKETQHRLTLAVPGEFNLENALCAIGCVRALGIDAAQAAEALGTFRGVAGRMEAIDEGQPFAVYVDFTVTPASYEKTLSAIRRTLKPSNRLLVLTGSCGNRMREKRPEIGRICSARADVVVVTEDETVTEDPLAVIDEVWAGIDREHCEAHKIPDRREAMALLLRLARPGDAVVFCGMGACTTMQTREGLRPWDERNIARELLHA